MKFVVVILFLCSSSVLFAQNWKRVFVAPNIVSSGFFHNENEGYVGTGFHAAGGPAQIYYTTNGGQSWTRSFLPNQQLTGQVTDIYFRDRANGWATIKNDPEAGWTGVYKTSDAGRTWHLTSQALYPTTIRETGRGIFLADRLVGILRSTNGGRSFTIVKAFSGALGLDFLNDNIGIHTGESGINSPVMITRDGGSTWTDAVIGREAWTAFADPTNGRLYYASERDNTWPPVESTIGMSTDQGTTFSTPEFFPGDGITGGMDGSRKCRSVLYVQGQDTPPGYIRGMLRSTDNGNTWVNVGGPSNYNDTRFVVTGRGSVVYAFDKFGGVWKTTNGGDGMISSSVRSQLLILPPKATTVAKLCDSGSFRIPIRFTGCEEIRITNVTYDEELLLIKSPTLLAATATKYDTLVFRYYPQQVGPLIKQIRISFLQADGTPEDTVISVNVEGQPIPDKPLVTTATGARTLPFGDISVCGGDSADVIMIANTGCAPMRVNALTLSNNAFSLLSAFKPFTLDPGISRKFLIYFKPQLPVTYTGTINIKTSFGADSITIVGSGIQGARALRLVQPLIETTQCDTPEYIFIIRNISCSEVRIDSLSVDSLFTLTTQANGTLLSTDSTVTLRFRLIPRALGTFPQTLRIYSQIKGERFDTTITVLAKITAGAATLSLPVDVIDFGDVSTCSFKVGSLSFSNTGCDSLRGSISQGTATDFTLVGPASFVLSREGSTAFAFMFKPTQVGLQTSTFTLTTNGGDRTIMLRGVGIDGSGTVEGIGQDVGTVLTCRDTSFTLQLINLGCDSVFFDSLVMSGNVGDYAIPPIGNLGIAVGDTAQLSGVFTPGADGQRPAMVVFYFHSRAGTLYQVPIQLSGVGDQPSLLSLSMPTNALLLPAGAQFTAPIDLQGLTALPVKSLTFSVETNTDFIQIERFDPSAQYAANATFDVQQNGRTLTVTAHFATPTIVQGGRFGEFVASVFLTDTLQATLTLTGFSISDSLPNGSCLPHTFDSSSIHVTLDPSCGDLVISRFLGGQSLIGISSIVPNPSSGQVLLTLRVPEKYSGMCTVELFDLHGRKVYERAVDPVNADQIPLSIDEANGMYQLRILSSGGSTSRNLQILR